MLFGKSLEQFLDEELKGINTSTEYADPSGGASGIVSDSQYRGRGAVPSPMVTDREPFIDTNNLFAQLQHEPEHFPAHLRPDSDKSMMAHLGRGIVSALDSASMNVGRLFIPGKGSVAETLPDMFESGKLDWLKSDNSWQTKVSDSLGETVGFLGSFSIAGAAEKAIIKNIPRVGSKSIAKSIKKKVADQLEKGGQIKWMSNQGTTKAERELLTEASAKSTFQKIYKDVWDTPLSNYSHGFRNASKQNSFKQKVEAGFADEFNKVLNQNGLEASDDLAKLVGDEFMRWYGKNTKPPVSDIATAIQRIMAKGGLPGLSNPAFGAAVGVIGQEAITFSMVEMLMEAVQATDEEREAHIGDVGFHAAGMGMLLGGIRLIPGGKTKANTLFPNPFGGKDGGFSMFRKLILGRKPYKGRVDFTKNSERMALLNVWEYLSSRNLGTGALGKIMQDSAKRHKHHLNKVFGGRTGKNSTKVHDYTLKELEAVLNQSGSGIRMINGKKVNQKEAIAEIMADALDDVYSQFRGRWVKDFFREYATDFTMSTPRMLLGSMAMGGGPKMLVDPDIPFEDKVLGFGLGGFMMKRGKSLKYYNKKGQAMEHEGWIGGKRKEFYSKSKLGESHLKELSSTMKLMGANPKEHWHWGNMADNLDIDPRMPWVSSFKDTETRESSKVREEFLREENGKRVYTTEKEPGEKQIRKEGKNDPGDHIKKLYKHFVVYSGNKHFQHHVEGKEQFVKDWEHLTSKEKKQFEKNMEDAGIREVNDFLDVMMETKMAGLDQTAIEVASNLRNAVEQLQKVLPEGSKRLMKVIEGDRLKFVRLDSRRDGDSKLTTDQANMIERYNSYVEFLVRSGKAELINRSPSDIGTIIDSKTPGVKEFMTQMEATHIGFNKAFGGREGEILLEPTDGVFIDYHRFAMMHKNVKMGSAFLSSIFESGYKTKHQFNKQELQKAGELIREIFQSEKGFPIQKIEAGKGQQLFAETMLEVLKPYLATPTPVKGGEFTGNRSGAKWREKIKTLDLILQKNGVTLVGDRYQNVRMDFIANMRRESLIHKIRHGNVFNPKTGKIEKINAGHVEQVVALVEDGFVNKDMTLHNVTDIMDGLGRMKADPRQRLFVDWANERLNLRELDTPKKFNEKVAREYGLVEKPESVKQLFENLEQSAQSMVTEGNVKNIKEARQRITESWGDVLHLYKDVVMPLVKTTRVINGKNVTSGILNLDKSQNQARDIGDLWSITHKLKLLQKKKTSYSVEKFMEKIKEVSQDPKSEYYEILNFALEEIAINPNNSQRVMELAQRHLKYKPETNEFEMKSETPTRNIEEFIEGLSRPEWGGKEHMEAHFRQYQRRLQEQSADGGYKTESLSDIVKKNALYDMSFSEGGTVQRKHPTLTVEKQIQNMYDKYTGMGKREQFKKELIQQAEQKNPELDVVEFGEKMDSLFLQLDSSIRVTKQKINLQDQHKWTRDDNHAIRKTSVWDIMHSAIGSPMGKRNFLPQITMIDQQIINANGRKSSLSNNAELVNEHLYNGDRVNVRESAKIAEGKGAKDLITEPEQRVLYRFGSNQYGYGVKADTKSLNRLANRYAEYVINNVKSKEAQTEILAEAGVRYNEKTKMYEVNRDVDNNYVVENIASGNRDFVKRVMDDMIYGELWGQSYWNEMRAYDTQSKTDWHKRLNLYNNVSTIKLRTDSIMDIYKRRQSSGLYKNAEGLRANESLRKWASGDYRQMTIRDEKGGFDSIFKTIQKQHELEIGKLPDGAKRDALVSEYNQIKDLLSDKSKFDGMTILRDELFDGMASLMGASGEGVGAIKPIVMRIGEQHFINKTAFQKDATLKAMWEANPNLGSITFTSASKTVMKDGKYHEWMENRIFDAPADFNLLAIEPSMYGKGIGITMKPEDVQLLSVKAEKKKATLSPLHTSGMTREGQRQFIETHVERKYDLAEKDINSLYNPQQFSQAVAFNRANFHDMYQGMTLESSTMGVHQMLAEVGAIPHIFQGKQFDNMIKKRLIDDIISLKVDGVSAVVSPDATGELKSSIMYSEGGRSKIAEIGELKLPRYAKDMPFDSKLTSVVLKSRKDLSVDVTTKDMKTVQEMGWKDLNTLGELHFFANQKGYDVLVALERNPHTKPDSATILRLHSFKSKTDGANATVNAVDFRRAQEGDHDLDTSSFYWDTGNEVRNSYLKQRGTVPDSVPTGSKNNKWSTNDIDVNTTSGHDKYLSNVEKGDMLKGKVMSYQPVIDALEHYVGAKKANSSGNETIIRVGADSYIKFNADKLVQIRQRLSNDIQGILDAKGGFDEAMYRNWENNFLFGEANGQQQSVFSYANKSDTRMKDVYQDGGFVSNPVHQRIIRDLLITPYREFSRLTSGNWETGVRESVGMAEFMTGVELYNSRLRRSKDKVKEIIREEYEGQQKRDELDAIETGFFDGGLTKQMQILSKNYRAELDHLTSRDRQMRKAYKLMEKSKVMGNLDRRNHEAEWMDQVYSWSGNSNVQNFWREHNSHMQSNAQKIEYVSWLTSKHRDLVKLRKNIVREGDLIAAKSYDRQIANVREMKDRALGEMQYKFDMDGKFYKKSWNKDSQQFEWKKSKPKGKNKKKQKLWEDIIQHKKDAMKWEYIRKIKGKEERFKAAAKFERNWEKKHRKQVYEDLQKNGVHFTDVKDFEAVQALIFHDVFSSKANMELFETGSGSFGSKDFQNISYTATKAAKRINKMINKAWSDFLDPKNDRYPNQEFVNEQIFREIEHRYNNFAEQNSLLAEQFLYKIATPEIDISRRMRIGENYYPAVKEGNHQTQINAVMKFIMHPESPYTPEMKRQIFQDIADASGRSFLDYYGVTSNQAFNGGELRLSPSGKMLEYGGRDYYGDVATTIKDKVLFYDRPNPFQYGRGGTVKDLLYEMSPQVAQQLELDGLSKLSQYDSMRMLYGMGSVRDIVANRNLSFIPQGMTRTKNGAYYSINGYKDYLRQMDIEMSGVVGNNRTSMWREGPMNNINLKEPATKQKKAQESVLEFMNNCPEGLQ